MVLKSRNRACKMSIFKKLSVVLYSVHTGTCRYVHIKKLSLRAAVMANRSITASKLGVSDRWICSIIRHSRRFSSECSFMCNVNVVNRISCFCLKCYFLEGIGVAMATLATPGYTPGSFLAFSVNTKESSNLIYSKRSRN